MEKIWKRIFICVYVFIYVYILNCYPTSVHICCMCRLHACVHTKLLRLCPTLCDPVDHSPAGFSVHGILQARILNWVAFPSPGDLSNPGIKPVSPAVPTLQVDSLPPSHLGKPCMLWRNPKELFGQPNPIYMTHFDVQLKLRRYCRSTMFQ